jgi:signal peptide peptidase SppA
MSKYFSTFKKFFMFLRTISLKKFFKVVFIIMIFLAVSITIKDQIEYTFGLGYWADEEFSDETIDQESGDEEVACNVYGIELHGVLLTYLSPEDRDADYNAIVDEVSSENILSAVRSAEEDDTIKAILMEVDSYGGSPVAGEEIRQALLRAQKPVVAYIREAGASGGYLAALGADEIIANKYSDIGSIGVTYSYLQNVQKNQKEGLEYVELSSGKFKDTGTPDKSLTFEEKQLYQRDIDIIYNGFVSAVAENRGLSIEQVKKIADGSTMLGEMALANGLIDQVGDMNVVRDYLKEKIGEDVEICW